MFGSPLIILYVWAGIFGYSKIKKLEKPCITMGQYTCQFLGLIFSCNKVILVDPAILLLPKKQKMGTDLKEAGDVTQPTWMSRWKCW